MPRPRVPKNRRAPRTVHHTLADGTVKIYRYPAHTAPRASVHHKDTVGALIQAWQSSPEWHGLAAATQDGYARYSRPLLAALGDRSFKKLKRGDIVPIRNQVAADRGRGAATAFVRAASAMFGWAVEQGRLDTSPMHRIKRLNGGHLEAWTEAEAELCMIILPEHLRRPVVLAYYTGQRRSDLIAMRWSAVVGDRIRLRQIKTGATLVLPVHPALRVELDMWRREADLTGTILVNKFGRPWTGSNLSKQLQAAFARFGEGWRPHLNIHGLRKLAAATLAEAGCSTKEIAAITGHVTLQQVALYTASADQERLAAAAMARLAARQQSGKS